MFQQKKIVIAGGTGFIGRAMAERWGADNEVVILSRCQDGQQSNYYGNDQLQQNVTTICWDAQTLGDWVKHLEGCDVLINLAGKSVNCRYTEKNKALIMSSRVDATNVLTQAIQQAAQPPKLWINGASATIYRHATDRPQDEYTGEIQNDFSVQVCKAWEQAFQKASLPQTRKVVLRLAIVFGKDGVLVPYKNLVKYGLGGRQGSGEQLFSWVHIEDVCRIVEWLDTHTEATGIYNVSSPNPVKNKELMKQLRAQMGMPFGLPASSLMLKMGALLIGTETELILKSRWVVPTRLLEEGYEFAYSTVDKALVNLI
ncbi:MAG: TIGR01777 family oxidoreductase [Flavipsychrobacter sp.]